MKFLVYLLLSYLVYRWFILPLFPGLGGNNSNLNDKQQNRNNIHEDQQSSGRDKGDYIDYEEVD
ncbi:MAG: hypothetical protein R2879_17455 [Saprospiraceae bacterium]